MTPLAQTDSAQAANRAGSAALGKQAQDQKEAKLREACQMFEAMFLNLLWKEMRRTVNKSGMMHGGFAEDMFTDMMDEAVSQASAGGGSMGIASMLEQQLSQTPGVRPSGRLSQNNTSLANEGNTQTLAETKSQVYLSRLLKNLSSKDAEQVPAGSYDQVKAAGATAWQTLPGNSNCKETPLSRWY